ncbi:hypothetical protein HETIRDRAFT_317830 [Heterobasidion irregulare TC 32-1]|uniref:Uncharacterized protein n=1 Tax=Heterobasidion irregulare (strain TC 32-1) TaxID=747525 RepID=W4K968_HETIT|nr:uncharacterized protein HETIRDRAFT_317830 [Heterobasidion irregulare TC 32-1]ETW82323.1 hypothetical protein HETIRDRAFT_317830 [Heterobasidion irregulare TC 32-1]
MRTAPESIPVRTPPVRDGLLRAQNRRPRDQRRRQNARTRILRARDDPAGSQGSILSLEMIGGGFYEACVSFARFPLARLSFFPFHLSLVPSRRPFAYIWCNIHPSLARMHDSMQPRSCPQPARFASLRASPFLGFNLASLPSSVDACIQIILPDCLEA